jgi:chromosome partitioning protein
MIRFVVSNQRGGVAKTTTAVTMARCLADQGIRVLLIDTDSQGSISAILNLKPELHLYDFLIGQMAFKNCIVQAHPKVDVLCSDRKTQQAEDIITTQTLREIYFEQIFTPHEEGYEAVIVDVAPSLTLFQTCAMVYTKQVLVPVAMETLSVQGAAASIQAGKSLNSLFKRKPDISVIGLLPVMVDRRLQMTDIVINTLEELSQRDNVPLLPMIRTDTAVVKAGRHRKFLADFDPKSKALEDYAKATDKVVELLRERANAETRQLQFEATQATN